jgi:hypothetical protein
MTTSPCASIASETLPWDRGYPISAASLKVAIRRWIHTSNLVIEVIIPPNHWMSPPSRLPVQIDVVGNDWNLKFFVVSGSNELVRIERGVGIVPLLDRGVLASKLAIPSALR